MNSNNHLRSKSDGTGGAFSPEEYFRSKERAFSQTYEQFKQFSKDLVLERQDFDHINQFADDIDISDWVVIKSATGDSKPTTTTKEGFLQCTFDPIVNKRRIKYLSHWVTLEKDSLNCYQSKESANQLKYRKLPLNGALLLNGQSYTGKKLSFRISCVGESTPVYFLCQNSKEYKSWYETIEKSILLHKEISQEEPAWMISLSNSDGDSYNALLDQNIIHDEITSFIEVEDAESSLTDAEMEWLDLSLEKHLSKHPECSSTIISDHVEMILNCAEHPLSRIYNAAIRRWKEEHYFMVYTVTDDEVIKKPVSVIKEITQKIVREFLAYYTNLRAFSKSAIYCTTAVESVLFGDLYDQVFSMYKLCFQHDDIMHTKKMNEFSSITPAHFGIDEHLWLLNDATLQIPYQDAINVFKNIREKKTPHEKANCLIETGNTIYSCVLRYYEKYHPKESVSLGGDELLPLFAYVVIRSRIPNPFSEFRFVQDFLNPALCKGEISYFLVTYETSLALISYLREETLDTWCQPQENKNLEAEKKESTSPHRRARSSSLIEVELNGEQCEDKKPKESDFLSWASSLIRK